jgi:hypothetical protein
MTTIMADRPSTATHTKRYRGYLNTIHTHTHTIYLFRVYFTIILPCTSTFSKLSPPFMFSDIFYLKYSSLIGCKTMSLELQSHNTEGITTPWNVRKCGPDTAYYRQHKFSLAMLWKPQTSHFLSPLFMMHAVLHLTNIMLSVEEYNYQPHARLQVLWPSG